jgi:UDP-N-acetyl-D-glucosamine dehydrogenase
MMSFKKKNICIQGMGFVGAAMLANLSTVKNKEGDFLFNIQGVDTSSDEGKRRINSINEGKFPFEISDEKIIQSIYNAHLTKRVSASYDTLAYAEADMIIIDVNFDQDEFNKGIRKSSFLKAIRQIANNMKPNVFILIETTVPPGTSEEIVIPEIKKILKKRNIADNKFLYAHSYERVMPGLNYLDSIKNYWRVYAGMNKRSSKMCKEFLEKFIDTKNFPLTELPSIKSSELAKVLENTYRAVTISLMDEWGKFSEKIGVDLFQVTEAIKMRPTHSNIRVPGLGVGGYCLTKDPIFGKISADNIYKIPNINFPVSSLAVDINKNMPNHAADVLINKYKGQLKNKKLLLMGVSYIAEVGDTRNSPSEIFYRKVVKQGAIVDCHDPYVNYWNELDINILKKLPNFEKYDAVILAVAHKFYLGLNYINLLVKNDRTILFDTNGILSKVEVDKIKNKKIQLLTIGR